jgi:hypothetical protein
MGIHRKGEEEGWRAQLSGDIETFFMTFFQYSSLSVSDGGISGVQPDPFELPSQF